MARFLMLLGLAVGLFLLFQWFFRQPARTRWQAAAVLLAVTLLVLVLTGRAHWLTAVFAAVLPFLRNLINLLGALPLLKRVLSGGGAQAAQRGPSGGQTSTVESKYLRMTLNHDSGDIDGEVLSGRFKGNRLAQMQLDVLLQLLVDCRDDDESIALLQAYLDRVYGDDWREQAEERDRRQPDADSGEMSRHEALQILGLGEDASKDEIVAAHRRLMQKLHPDRGGSAYLAARINLAKETLLGS